MGYFQSNFEGQIMDISSPNQELNQSGFGEIGNESRDEFTNRSRSEWDELGQECNSDDEEEKKFDPALFDVTKIPVNDFANQITRDDFEIFKKITTEEVIPFSQYGH